jgi:O-methyltransferase
MGGSANLILSSNLDSTKKMHLFDTFAGLPETTQGLDGALRIGNFRGSSVSKVKDKLKRFKETTEYHVGFFPDTTKGLPLSSRYSLVHLDADTYQTTLAAVTYFYPLMTPGSFFIFHDYSSISCPGVRRAIDGFFLDKNEVVIPLWHTQALVIMQ